MNEFFKKQLNDEMFGSVEFVSEDVGYLYYKKTYSDGKQDDVRVRKTDGNIWFKHTEKKYDDWNDYEVKLVVKREAV